MEDSKDDTVSAKKFIDRVKSYIKYSTDPEIIAKILEDLNLSEMRIRDENFSDFVLKLQNESIDMTLFLEKLETDLLNSTIIPSLFSYIQDENLVSDDELSAMSNTIQLQINLLCLFEAMAVTMVNSLTMVEDIYRYFISQRNNKSPGSSVDTFMFGFPANSTFFERLKIISIEPMILLIIFHNHMINKKETEEDVKKFETDNQLSGFNTVNIINDNSMDHSVVSGMALNILEAIWKDSVGDAREFGGLDNAKAGFGLIHVMEKYNYPSRYVLKNTILPEGINLDFDGTYPLIPGLRVTCENRNLNEFIIHPEWMELYNAWNLEFIVSNIDNVFLPIKLLLPSVFSSEPSNFKEIRGMTLYLFANIFINNKDAFTSFNYRFRHGTEILEQFGKLNKSFSEKFIRDRCPGSVDTPDSLYNNLLGEHQHLNFARNLLSYYRHRHQENNYFTIEAHDVINEGMEGVVQACSDDEGVEKQLSERSRTKSLQ